MDEGSAFSGTARAAWQEPKLAQKLFLLILFAALLELSAEPDSRHKFVITLVDFGCGFEG